MTSLKKRIPVTSQLLRYKLKQDLIVYVHNRADTTGKRHTRMFIKMLHEATLCLFCVLFESFAVPASFPVNPSKFLLNVLLNILGCGLVLSSAFWGGQAPFAWQAISCCFYSKMPQELKLNR